MSVARTVVLEHDPEESEWVTEQLGESTFTNQLREKYGTVETDDTLSGSLTVGGCGDEMRVELTVSDISGGTEIAPDTEFRIVPRS